jgi:serine/threonine protein kinase
MEKLLGKGGFGEVWLATERASGRRVAVKILSMASLPRSMIEQEITAMRRCGSHPNVVTLLDVIWVQPDNVNPHGEAVLVMELAAGGGLFERLVEEGAYSEK